MAVEVRRHGALPPVLPSAAQVAAEATRTQQGTVDELVVVPAPNTPVVVAGFAAHSRLAPAREAAAGVSVSSSVVHNEYSNNSNRSNNSNNNNTINNTGNMSTSIMLL